MIGTIALIALALLYLNLWRYTFAGFYRDFADEWHIGLFLCGLVAATALAPIMGWMFWGELRPEAGKLRLVGRQLLKLRAGENVAKRTARVIVGKKRLVKIDD